MARILSVDDHEENRYLLEVLLGAAGHEVASAANGVEALALLEAQPFDLIISDILMPRMDGFQFCREVKRREAYRHLPFIFYSATYTEAQDQELGLSLGASRFLVKPAEPETFLVAVQELLAEGTAHPAPAGAGPSEQDYLEAYNQRLIHKLEDKIAELEGTSRELNAALAARDRDLAERMKAESEIRRLHLAISQVPNAVLITDPKGVIVYANPAIERISGYAVSELLGRSASLFRNGGMDEDFYRSIWETSPRLEAWRGLFVNQRKDGKTWEAEATISPVFDASCALASYVCSLRDVTRERQLQSQLEQSQRLEAIGVLAAGIAHDFNNILMPILTHAELGLQREPLDAALRKDLEVIEASAHRAAALTQQVLGYARKQSQTVGTLDLALLVKESIKLLRAAIPSSIRFDVKLTGSGLFVTGDPTQLHQILLNLCSNAAHAMRGQSGNLSILLHAERLPQTDCAQEMTLAPGDFVVLEVADTGHGMAEDTLARIFQPFFTTKGPGEGAGLGLAIILGIVQDMGGGIQVESHPGEGTCFRVLLPRTAPPEPATQSGKTEIPRGSERILLVDDEEVLSASLQTQLELLGYQVEVFHDPQIALEAVRANPSAFKLVLTDFTMPGLSGTALIRAIRELCPRLPALLMTGVAGPSLDREVASARPDDLLTKPFTIQRLGLTVRQALDGSASDSR